MKNIKMILLFTIIIFLITNCASSLDFYRQHNKKFEIGNSIQDTLIIMKIIHNREKSFLEAGKVSFTYKIIDNPDRNKASIYTEIYLCMVRPNDEDGYLYLLYGFDKKEQKDGYGYLADFNFTTTRSKLSGNFKNIKSNISVPCKYGDIIYAGIYYLNIGNEKYNLKHVYPDNKNLKDAYTIVMKTFQGTKFEKQAKQKLKELN